MSENRKSFVFYRHDWNKPDPQLNCFKTVNADVLFSYQFWTYLRPLDLIVLKRVCRLFHERLRLLELEYPFFSLHESLQFFFVSKVMCEIHTYRNPFFVSDEARKVENVAQDIFQKLSNREVLTGSLILEYLDTPFGEPRDLSKNNFSSNDIDILSNVGIDNLEFCGIISAFSSTSRKGMQENRTILYPKSLKNWHIEVHCDKNGKSLSVYELFTGVSPAVYDINYMPQDDHEIGIHSITLNVSKTRRDVPLIKYIEDNFDFDFCKLAYDGRRLRIYSLESIIKKRSCSKISAFLKDEIRINRTEILKNKSKYYNAKDERILKYEKRGYTIEKNHDLEDLIENTQFNNKKNEPGDRKRKFEQTKD
jgi:hypothetical protein